MQKKYRLGGRRTFSYIYAKGSRASGRYVTVIYCPARRGLRIGAVAGKKVGKSVVRNKVKRRMKEIARRFIPYLENGFNYILPLFAAIWRRRLPRRENFPTLQARKEPFWGSDVPDKDIQKVF